MSSSEPKLTGVAGIGDSLSDATQVSVLAVLLDGLLLIFLTATAEGIAALMSVV